MGTPFEDVIAGLPPDRQVRIKARSQALIDQEMTLRALRTVMGHTQASLASRLGIKQENVSRIEHRADMLLSTLNEYLASMGGRLTLVAEFEGRRPVKLSGFGASGVVEGDTTPMKRKKIGKAA